MDKQGITADKKTVFDLKFFIKWGIAIGVPCILYFAIPQTEAVSLEMRKFFVCTAWAILTWAMNLLPVYISGLLLTVGAILWGVAPANVVLSPWTGSVVWLSLGGLTLSVIFEKSGLMQRIAYFFIVKSGGSYKGIITGITLSGIVVGLLVAIFQAATQIHEQTLTFVPKLLVIALVLLALGSWMSKVMNEFVVELFAIMAAL